MGREEIRAEAGAEVPDSFRPIALSIDHVIGVDMARSRDAGMQVVVMKKRDANQQYAIVIGDSWQVDYTPPRPIARFVR